MTGERRRVETDAEFGKAVREALATTASQQLAARTKSDDKEIVVSLPFTLKIGGSESVAGDERMKVDFCCTCIIDPGGLTVCWGSCC